MYEVCHLQLRCYPVPLRKVTSLHLWPSRCLISIVSAQKSLPPECFVYSELSLKILGTQVSLWMDVLLTVLVVQSHGFLNPK